MKEIEEMLGRPLKKAEQTIYSIYKNNKQYYFSKDKFGNLSVKLKEEFKER